MTSQAFPCQGGERGGLRLSGLDAREDAFDVEKALGGIEPPRSYPPLTPPLQGGDDVWMSEAKVRPATFDPP